jgi:hypothetical protein
MLKGRLFDLPFFCRRDHEVWNLIPYRGARRDAIMFENFGWVVVGCVLFVARLLLLFGNQYSEDGGNSNVARIIVLAVLLVVVFLTIFAIGFFMIAPSR